jgi:RHS repeat-associated protein
MMMPGREYQAQPSRFGFNGKENDNEVKGFGNQQDYGMRIYDTRIGRFLSVDPLTKDFPGNSPYTFAEGDPVSNIDLDGGERKHYLLEWDENHRIAHLTYSHTSDFTETKTKWTPTFPNIFNTTSTTQTNPRVEYVVHGQVNVRLGIDGNLHVSTEDVTWTFSSEEKMRETEASRHESVDGSLFSNKWVGAATDQRWAIAINQAAFANLQAEMETGGMRGLWAGGRKSTSTSTSTNNQATSATGSTQASKSNTATWVEQGIVPDYLVIRYNKLNLQDRSGKPFTVAGKGVVKQINEHVNGGNMKCVDCGIVTPPAQQSKKNVTPKMNEAHVDHVDPKRTGGSGTPINGDIRCFKCNVIIKN